MSKIGMVYKKNCLVVVFLFVLKLVSAQSGGPPMLTDDPGVGGVHKWDINSSITVLKSNMVQAAVPYLDINYGILPDLALKLEFPYLVNFERHKKTSGELGDMMAGLKYRFLNEEKGIIAAGVFPQLTLTGSTGFLLPLLLEKTFGRFMVGNAIGHYWGNQNSFQNGSLLGYQVNERTELMGEYFLEKEYQISKTAAGYVNVGFRHRLTPVITLIGSVGTQVKTPAGRQREYLISFLGINSYF